MVAETTKRGQWSGDRQRERIFRGAAFRAAGSTALDPQTAGSTVPVRTVALTSEQAVKQDLLVHSLQPRHLFGHSFQSRHRHSIVMTLHMHVGPGLESFVRKTSFVFIVAILR